MDPLRQGLLVQTPSISPNQGITNWTVEPRYTTLQFSSKVVRLFSVTGEFRDFNGIIELDEDELRRSKVSFTIRAASIHTGNSQRDSHLRSVAFLSVENFPEIRFQSTKVERGRDRDALHVTGNLEIRGISREVMLDILETDRSQSPQGEEVAYYAVRCRLDRFDFGIRYARGLIGRDVLVTASVQATKMK